MERGHNLRVRFCCVSYLLQYELCGKPSGATKKLSETEQKSRKRIWHIKKAESFERRSLWKPPTSVGINKGCNKSHLQCRPLATLLCSTPRTSNIQHPY